MSGNGNGNGNGGGGAHILVIPYPAQGHLIPLLDHAQQLSSRGLLVTVLVTPKNLPLLDPLLSKSSPTSSIQTLVLPFPRRRPDLIPDGVENVKDLPVPYFRPMMRAFADLHAPALAWARSHPTPPTAVISDIFVGWTLRLAADLAVPRIVFSPSGAFATCVVDSLWRRMPSPSSDSDSDVVSFPDIPGSPAYPWSQLSNVYRSYMAGDELSEFIKEGMLANAASWGLVVNSFADLEEEYLDHLKKTLGRVWAVGPLHLQEEKSGGGGCGERGGSSSVRVEEVMRWLSGRQEGSVVFVCFGSQAVLSRRQMAAVAEGLRRSGAAFVWCVKEATGGHDADNDGVVPAGFEAAVGDRRGLVIRGWAPQVAILGHASVGAFLSHCGWNSVLEGIVGGVSFLAWPMGADQFVNATLLHDSGVAVRVCDGAAAVPDPDELARALADSVDSGRPQRRARATELSAAASAAVAAGGSSVKDLDALVHQLTHSSQPV